jgi:hypothetical protein
VPILDACVSQQLTFGGWAAVAWRAGLQALRRLGLLVLPAGLRRRFRGTPVLRRLFLRNEEAPGPDAEHRRKWGLDA